MLIADVARAVASDRWALTAHAREQAGMRRIGDEELVQVLASGEILEDYSHDPRGPSSLALGHTHDGRSLHVVCAFDPDGTLLVITVYEPELPWWRNERTRMASQGEY
jgi:Domain of unknown function (DUF4258)